MPSRSLAEEFGIVVREMRVARGFSQEKFALHCGINRSYWTHIERGRRLPSILVVARIARGFGIEVSNIWLELERRGATAEAVTDEPKLI